MVTPYSISFCFKKLCPHLNSILLLIFLHEYYRTETDTMFYSLGGGDEGGGCRLNPEYTIGTLA